MSDIFNLLILQFIVVFIVDLSGFIGSIKTLIWRWIFNNKKEYREFRLPPFDCSLCMVFWSGLIYLIAVHQFNMLTIGYVVLLSFTSDLVGSLAVQIKDILIRLVNKI